MTDYLIFDAVQRPFEISPTPDDHAIWSCNYLPMIGGVTTSFLEEVAKKLADAGLVVQDPIADRTIYLGMRGVIPTNGGPFTRLIAQSGVAPDIAYGVTDITNTSIIDKPGLQVLVYAEDDLAAEAKSLDIYLNLITSVNVELST